jgi:hypothetical protein
MLPQIQPYPSEVADGPIELYAMEEYVDAKLAPAVAARFRELQ